MHLGLIKKAYQTKMLQAAIVLLMSTLRFDNQHNVHKANYIPSHSNPIVFFLLQLSNNTAFEYEVPSIVCGNDSMTNPINLYLDDTDRYQIHQLIKRLCFESGNQNCHETCMKPPIITHTNTQIGHLYLELLASRLFRHSRHRVC